MKNFSQFLVLLTFALAVLNLPAHARMRMHYEDPQIVERSDLIVVAAIKEGSVVLVPHPKPFPDAGTSSETHATLLIREVIKGKCSEKELPIVIRHGLSVYIDDQSTGQAAEKPTTLPAPKKSMSIIDTGNSSQGGPPVAADARKDHIWFLRITAEHAPATDKGFGITDPEDVQPLALKKYLESYLAKDPEAAVRKALQTNPEIAGRALRYLQHCEIARILQEKDLARRVEKLLPYYQSRTNWGIHDEARDAIIDAGEVAGPYLMALYKNHSTPTEFRENIIRTWAAIRYAGATQTLIDLLSEEDKFWATQSLQPDWRNDKVDPALTAFRQERANLAYKSVYALGQIADPRAREVLELTQRRWSTFPSENYITKACEDALKSLPPPKK